jgi:hypothetical protein
MQPYLRFIPARQGIRLEPKQVIPVTTYEEDRVIKKQNVALGGYKQVADTTGLQTLKVRREDADICSVALAWRTGQSEVSFSTIQFATNEQGHTIQVERKGDIIDIPLPGAFEPILSVDDVHSICEDFRLLGQKFPIYNSIFQVKVGENAFTRGLLEFLLASNRELVKIVSESGGEDIKECIEKVKLPRWIERILQLRAQEKGTAGDGWE